MGEQWLLGGGRREERTAHGYRHMHTHVHTHTHTHCSAACLSILCFENAGATKIEPKSDQASRSKFQITGNMGDRGTGLYRTSKMPTARARCGEPQNN